MKRSDQPDSRRLRDNQGSKWRQPFRLATVRERSHGSPPQALYSLLQAHGLRPDKRLGQNFLIDASALERIVAAADLTPSDLVVEVGAGTGTLTRYLAKAAGWVIALELDRTLVEILHEKLADWPNVEIVAGDVLDYPKEDLQHLGYKVVGNLPYYITSAILRYFLEREPRPRLMVVTVQREVAERVVAHPGDMSLLAVSVQFYGRPQIVRQIPASSFYPEPEVDSTVLRIDVGEQPTVFLAEGVSEASFFQAVRAGFGQRRKTLRNSLSAGLALEPRLVEQALVAAGVEPSRRAETLSLEEWAGVAASCQRIARTD